MTAIRSVLGPHWDLYFDFWSESRPSIMGEATLKLNLLAILGGPQILTTYLSILPDFYSVLIVFRKIASSFSIQRIGSHDDLETLRRYVILQQQPSVTTLTAETAIKMIFKEISKALSEYQRDILLLCLAKHKLLLSSAEIISIPVSVSSSLFSSYSLPLSHIPAFSSVISVYPYASLVLIPLCILPLIQELISSLDLKFSLLPFLSLTLATSQSLRIDCSSYSELVDILKLSLLIKPFTTFSQKLTESIGINVFSAYSSHYFSAVAETIGVDPAYHSIFRDEIASSLYLKSFAILPGVISLTIYQALALLASFLFEEHDIHESDLKIQSQAALTLWYLFSESLKWQLRSQTIQRFVEETALTFRSSAPQLPMFVYTALTLFPSAEFILPTPPARYPTFYDFVGSAWIFRKSFWHTYQKGWIDKDNVDETTYKRVGLQYPEGYEKLDRREKRKEIKIKTRRKKELSLEELNELL